MARQGVCISRPHYSVLYRQWVVCVSVCLWEQEREQHHSFIHTSTSSTQLVKFLTGWAPTQLENNRSKMKLTEGWGSKPLKSGPVWENLLKQSSRTFVMSNFSNDSEPYKIFYFLCLLFGFESVYFLRSCFVLCLVVAVHIAAFNYLQAIRYEMNRFWTRECPFLIKSSVLAVYLSLF